MLLCLHCAAKEITEAKLDAELKFDGFIPVSRNEDLCVLLKDSPYPCPLKNQDYNIKQSMVLPDIPKVNRTTYHKNNISVYIVKCALIIATVNFAEIILSF